MRIACHHCHENTALSIDVRCHGLVHPRTAAPAGLDRMVQEITLPHMHT